jgi:hypothetical protein
MWLAIAALCLRMNPELSLHLVPGIDQVLRVALVQKHIA